MKKYFVVLITLLFVFASSISLFAKKPSKGYVKDNVKNSVLKVRAKPKAKSEVKAKLYIGNKVDILKKREKWFKIKTSTTKGWVKKKYIKVTDYDYSDEKKSDKKKVNLEKSATKVKIKKDKSLNFEAGIGATIAVMPPSNNTRNNINDLGGSADKDRNKDKNATQHETGKKLSQ